MIAAYNDMIAYPGSGTQGHPDLLIGLGIINAPNYPFAWGHLYPNPTFLVRHGNGTYDFQPITPPSGAFPISTRTIAVSQFPGDPAGTIYAGGYDAHSVPNAQHRLGLSGDSDEPLGPGREALTGVDTATARRIRIQAHLRACPAPAFPGADFSNTNSAADTVR